MGVVDKGLAVQGCSLSRELALLEDFQGYPSVMAKTAISVLKL